MMPRGCPRLAGTGNPRDFTPATRGGGSHTVPAAPHPPPTGAADSLQRGSGLPPAVYRVALVRSLQKESGVMARLIVHRRRDGLVQLRRRRVWDVISARETAAILLLSACSFGFSLALVAALTAPRVLLALVPLIPVVALGFWAARSTQAALAVAPVDEPPPPRRVA